MSPEIMNEVFEQRNNSHYKLKHTSQFSENPIHSVYNGTESASYLLKFEIRNPLKVLSGRSRGMKKRTALVEFVKSSYR